MGILYRNHLKVAAFPVFRSVVKGNSEVGKENTLNNAVISVINGPFLEMLKLWDFYGILALC